MAAFLGQELDRNNCRAANEETRRQLGCTQELPEYRWMDICGIEVRGCPFCQVSQTPEIFSYLRLFRFFKMGHLMSPGGLMNQNPVLMDAFEIIDRVEMGKNGRAKSVTD